MSITNQITCPSSCGSFLPVVTSDYCDPQIEFGEISKVFVMGYDGSDLANWELLSDWTSRLSQDDVADIDKIRTLTVSGDQPLPEKETLEISDNRKVSTPSTFTLNIDIDDVTDEIYEFFRTMECNTRVKIWYTAGNFIFGGNEGIIADIDLSYMIERGQKVPQKITGTIKWDAAHSPARGANPFV